MEELVMMILRGLIIGVVISAPMGPVGIYCLQRTLDKGRLSGFYTGIGAAVSDFIYCLMTGFGLSFIEDFINGHRYTIQLLGSIVLIVFGIWLMRKQPDGQMAADAGSGTPSREGDILKGFALTFSNPLILFLIIGLFAQFNFVIEGMKFYHYILGFLGIIGGALGWWWVVTYFVDKLRGHFTRRTMKRINMAIGFIILIFAAVGIFSSASSLLAGVRPEAAAEGGVLESVEFRVADTSMGGWRVEFGCAGGGAVFIEVGPCQQGDPFGDTKTDLLSVRAVDGTTGSVIGEASVSEGIDPYRGFNSWRVVREGERWNVFAGNREYRHVLEFSSRHVPVGAPLLTSASPGGMESFVGDVKSAPVEAERLSEADVLFALEQAGARPHALSGIYAMLDFELDDAYARIGGSYRVAVVASEDDGAADVYYLDGARENAGFWHGGMKKGRLLPTPFVNVYDVEWRDARGEWMLHDVQAEFDATARTLTVKFPYQSSSMRLRKE